MTRIVSILFASLTLEAFGFTHALSLSSPVPENVKIPISNQPNSLNGTTSTPNVNVNVNNTLRQDGEDVGEGFEAAVSAIDTLQQITGPIVQIVTGTFSGNITRVFTGITGTIVDEDVRPGVGTILSGVASPLSLLWAQGQKYFFNITTTPPPQLQQPVQIQVMNPAGVQSPTNINSKPSTPNVPRPSVVIASENDNDDDDSKLKSNFIIQS